MILLQQTSFMNSTKQELKISEFIVYCGFSENYSFVVQHEAQDYHWSNEKIPIYPFVIFLKNEKEVKHGSYVIISECLKHNTIAFYLSK